MSEKKHYTPGPWRWGDWSATFGSFEDPRNMRHLERNLTHQGPEPYKCGRADGRYGVLQVEEAIDKQADRELIRRAPELADALSEMLDMFGGNMDRSDYERFRALANPQSEPDGADE